MLVSEGVFVCLQGVLTQKGEFEALYIGSVAVKDATGNDVCSDAVTRVKVILVCSQPADHQGVEITHKERSYRYLSSGSLHPRPQR